MYVKDESANLNTLITTLMKIMACTPFMLLMSYSSHVMGMQCLNVVNMLITISKCVKMKRFQSKMYNMFFNKLLC